MRFSTPARAGVAVTLAATALFALPAAAQAPDELPPIEVDVDARVVPNKAGTPAHPQGVRLIVDAKLVSPLGVERPILQRGTVLFPKGGLWNGARHPSCSQSTLSRQGLRGCPKGAIFGHGVATGYADDVITRPRITVVNGGATRVYFYTQLTNPALVEAPVVGKIRRLRGKWSYRLDFAVPEELQVVAGVPITVTKLHLESGRGDILATTYCPPSGRWPYESTLQLSDGRRPFIEGSTPCRR